MVIFVCGEDISWYRLLPDEIELLVFFHFRMPWAMAVDVFPRIGADERQITWSNSYDISINIMELFDISGEISLQNTKYQRQSCSYPGFGTRKFGKWMKVYIVDYVRQRVDG